MTKNAENVANADAARPIKPRLTAVITNYNYGHFLPAAVEAMVNQSRPADELILIDDASTDGSQRVVDEMARRFPFIKVVKHAVNRGMNPTGQEALEMATGEYLYWGSADDMVLPGFFESAMTLAEQHPDAPLCAGVPIHLREETAEQFQTGDGMPESPCRMAPQDLWPVARRGGLILSGAWAVYRIADLKASGGFHGSLKWLSDWYPLYAFALCRGICWTAQPSAVLRYHSGNYSIVVPRRKLEHRGALEALARLVNEAPPEIQRGMREGGMLGHLGPVMGRVLISDRSLWRQLSRPVWEALIRSTAYRFVLGMARILLPTRWRRVWGRRTRKHTNIDLSAMDSRKAI